jgi:hypothetical protein
VRDVFRIYDERLALMLTVDEAKFANWDQDTTAVEQRYDVQDAGEVSTALRTAGRALAARFDGLRGPQWQRTGFRSDGKTFTVATFAVYMVHDPVHHLWDVTSQ